MFFAINSKTNEKVNSLTIEENPSYQFIKEEIWFADPDEIDSCTKEMDINKIIVNFREGHRTINYNSTEYAVSPHFFILNKTKLGINTIPESKEHKLAKNWIYNKIKQKKLMINYSDVNKPYKYKHQINLFDLPIDYQKIGIEVTSSLGYNNTRRADVICPFLTKHDILGNGIIFEIQFSNQKEKTKISRELDWSIRGYSIAWLYRNDFNEISDLIIDIKKDSVDIESFAFLIKQNNKSFIRDLKFIVQDECRKLEEKRYEIIKSIGEAKINQLTISKIEIKELIQEYFNEVRKNLQPICPKCKIPLVLKKNQYSDNKFWACSNYPNCKITSQYEEEE